MATSKSTTRRRSRSWNRVLANCIIRGLHRERKREALAQKKAQKIAAKLALGKRNQFMITSALASDWRSYWSAFVAGDQDLVEAMNLYAQLHCTALDKIEILALVFHDDGEIEISLLGDQRIWLEKEDVESYLKRYKRSLNLNAQLVPGLVIVAGSGKGKSNYEVGLNGCSCADTKYRKIPHCQHKISALSCVKSQGFASLPEYLISSIVKTEIEVHLDEQSIERTDWSKAPKSLVFAAPAGWSDLAF